MRKRETLTDLMKGLEADPSWVARRQALDEERSQKVERYRAAAKPIIRDLATAGIKINDEWDLVNSRNRYDAALPVLLKHLRLAYPDVVREGMARALARPWARDIAWDQVLDAYLHEPNKSKVAAKGELGAPSGPKEGMAIALSGMARPGDLGTLIDLISNPENGPSRIFFVSNLSRSRSLSASDALARLADDGDLYEEIAFRAKSKLQREARNARSSKQRH